jgi:glycosyltransferase involved in cell wall biosynthesis
MKILLITDNHSPTGGGAEKYFFRLKNELQKHAELDVYSLGFGLTATRGKDFQVFAETPSKAWRQWWRMFFNPRKYNQLRQAITRIHPHVIHLHNIKKYTPALLKAVRGYRVIQTVHDYSPICPTGWNVHRHLQTCDTGITKHCLWQHRRHYHPLSYLALLYSFFKLRQLSRKNIHHFISPSPLLTQYLQQHQFSPTTCILPFKNEHTALPIQQIKENHFLYVGQLENQKGIRILIEEFALACKKNAGLILKIAGTGAEAAFLQQRVKQLSLENNIIFLGWINNLETLYAECTALIFTSIGLESFGLVITEAMSYARAVIGSNRGPTPWLIDDKQTGLLFNPLNTGELAEKILTLANNLTLAQQYGEAGYHKVNGFLSNAEITDQLIALYKKGA